MRAGIHQGSLWLESNLKGTDSNWMIKCNRKSNSACGLCGWCLLLSKKGTMASRHHECVPLGVGTDTCNMKFFYPENSSVAGLTWSPVKQPAAAKSLQSYPTLCDPIDGSPPGSPIPGILQARTLEWVAISFSNQRMVQNSKWWRTKYQVADCMIFREDSQGKLHREGSSSRFQ